MPVLSGYCEISLLYCMACPSQTCTSAVLVPSHHGRLSLYDHEFRIIPPQRQTEASILSQYCILSEQSTLKLELLTQRFCGLGMHVWECMYTGKAILQTNHM